MGSKVIRNITKVFKSASGVLFGRFSAGTGRGEELTPLQVRSLLNVYTTSETDTAISTAVNSLVAGAPGLLDTLDELSAALGDDANFASTVTTALAGKVDTSTLNESIDDRVAALLVAGTNITITYNDAANALTIAASGGGLSGTGSVDNAVLRADGTGGATLQNSAIVIDDLYTASPNNTVNFTCIKPTGGTTNVGVAIVPKGTGAFCLQVPDGTITGGNTRGANAVDLQTVRSAAAQVASSTFAVAIGSYCTASGSTRGSYAIGHSCSATGVASTAVGDNATASGQQSLALGSYPTASGIYATALQYAFASGTYSFAHGYDAYARSTSSVAFGHQVDADRASMFAFGNGRFTANGDAQSVSFVLRNKSTNTTPTSLFLNGSASRLTIPSGKVLSAICRICGIKSDGSAVANYVRRVVIKNVGGTTSLVGSVETLGTDIEDSPGVTDVTITADNTNDSLDIAVTAEATWRWLAVVDGLEISYGV